MVVFARQHLVPAVLTAVIVPYLFLPEAFKIPLPGLPDLTKTSVITVGLLLGLFFFGPKTRPAIQLTEIKRLVCSLDKPCMVAGDFNAFKGHDELELFREAAGLLNAGPVDSLTYPSWKPTRSLDFILHTPDIVINEFRIPQVNYSDHLPLTVDFEIKSD